MAANEHAEGGGGERENDTTRAVSQAGVAGDPEQEGEDGEYETRKSNRRLRDYVKQLAAELKLSDWLMVVLTAVIAGSTVWNTVYVGGQLAEMRSSSQDSKNLVIATQHLVDRAKDQADALDKLRQAGHDQAKATGDLKDITQTQVDKIAGLYEAIQASAKAAEKGAKATLAQSQATQAEAESVKGQTAAVQQSLVATRDMASATRDTAKASEHGNDIANRAYLAADRPWTGVSHTSFSTKPAADTEFKVTITIQNTGRSPSLNTRGQFYMDIVDVKTWNMPNIPECGLECSSVTLLPQSTTGYAPLITKEKMSADRLKGIQAITSAIVVFGRIDYADDAGGKHTTLWCNFWNTTGGDLSACSRGNDAN